MVFDYCDNHFIQFKVAPSLSSTFKKRIVLIESETNNNCLLQFQQELTLHCRLVEKIWSHVVVESSNNNHAVHWFADDLGSEVENINKFLITNINSDLVC